MNGAAYTGEWDTMPRLSLTILLATAIVMAGCTSTAYTPEPPTPTPTLAPPRTPTPTPAQAPANAPTSADQSAYDPNETMRAIFSDPGQTLDGLRLALADAVAANDASQVPIIVEMMRFTGAPVVMEEYRQALLSLTGQDFGIDPQAWNKAMEWLGPRRDQFPPPEEYLEWKANLLSLIDPRMAAFLTSVPGSERIDLTEVVWGGVLTDGIPDLQFAPTITPEEADYLVARDRVFGVSINGEHRAYPLRIMNPHEMANDWLGGEPIALAY